jgi:hypothetical protein
MNTSKLADIAEITSSIAILVTLIFLVVQMQQNTQAINSGALQAMFSDQQDELRFQAQNHGISAIGYKSNLSDQEKAQLHFLLLSTFRAREHEWIQFEKGVIDSATLESWSAGIAGYLRASNNRRWWRNVGRNDFVPGFVAYVDGLFKDTPTTNQPIYVTAFDEAM